MEIHEIKKNKSHLQRMISFLLDVQFALIILAVLSVINFLAFASGFIWAIFIAVLFDVTLVLMFINNRK